MSLNSGDGVDVDGSASGGSDKGVSFGDVEKKSAIEQDGKSKSKEGAAAGADKSDKSDKSKSKDK